MFSFSPTLIEDLESKAVDWLQRLNARRLGHFRREHLWYFATVFPALSSFFGFFTLIITFHADGNLDETGKAPLFFSILLFGVIPFGAHFYLSFYDVLLPNFLLLFQMIQLSAAIALCAMGYVDRQWYALAPCLIFILLPNLIGWIYGIFCFHRCRKRTMIAGQYGLRSFWKRPRMEDQNAETDSNTPDLLALEYFSRFNSVIGASFSPRRTNSAGLESLWSTASGNQSAVSEMQQSGLPLPPDAPVNQRQPPSSIQTLEFEPNQAFSERYMPICLAYGSAIILTGALESVATLTLTRTLQSPSEDEYQRIIFILGLTLPIFDTVLLLSFLLWTVSRKSITIRAYVFEVLQLFSTVIWVTLTVLFEIRPAPESDDMHALLFVPILITMQMVVSALHAIFLVHFAYYLHISNSESTGRITL